MANKRQIWAWCMYDWANSAYSLTVMTAVLPVYFADVIVGPEGFSIAGTSFSATTLWGYTISAAGLLVLVISPVLGAMADVSASKKKFLMMFCYLGSLFTILLFFCQTGDVWTTIVLMLLSQVGFVGGNVFYDAFLPHLGGREALDIVSTRGYAYGYIGGALQFLLALALIMMHGTWRLSQSDAVRLALMTAGLWWAGFSLVTWAYLEEPPSSHQLPQTLTWQAAWRAYARMGLRHAWQTTKAARRYQHVVMFLIGFMMYNEGIQTVIAMATIFGREELELTTSVLMITLVVIQFIAIGGSMVAGWLAGRLGTKNTLVSILVIWLGGVVYAHRMTSAAEYMVLGGVVGLVLGGSQALSRSYYASMIPKESSAEFYGFYSVFTKLSAIGGPFIFGLIRQLTGSSRLSILSVAVFFLLGIVFLILTREPSTEST